MQPTQQHRSEPRVYDLSDDSASARRKSILVLEDDPNFSGMLQATLPEQGYLVTVAPSGTEGLRLILASDFDAILCDMVMPNFPGDMFFLAVQRTKPHLCPRFIFMTGHENDPKIATFIQKSGSLALWKPFQLRQLFDALETVTGRSK